VVGGGLGITWDFGKLLIGGFLGVAVYLLGSYWLKFDEPRFILDYLQKRLKKQTK
jgi:hypothetical protein